MSAKAEQFFTELKKAVESDKLVLPTLPEVALKIRSAVEDDNASAQKIADTLTQDASLSARLIQVAARQLDVLGLNGGAHLVDGDALRGQPVRIDVHVDGALVPAQQDHLPSPFPPPGYPRQRRQRQHYPARHGLRRNYGSTYEAVVGRSRDHLDSLGVV